MIFYFRNILFLSGFFLTAVLAPLAMAGTVQGEVTAVNPNGEVFTVKRDDSPAPSEINFAVTRDSELEGIDTVLDLATGDEVIVDAADEKNEAGKFEARAVRISKIKIHEPVTAL